MQDDLTPAQSKLLDTLRAATAPVVVEGERRYTTAGERLHYATVEALERRGYLRRAGGELLLVEAAPVDTEEARAPATPPADSPPLDDLTITPDDLDDLDRTATRYAELRRHDDLDLDDPGAAARAALLARRDPPPLGELLLDQTEEARARIVETPPRARAYPPAPRKEQRQDQSVFSGLWRLLRGALS